MSWSNLMTELNVIDLVAEAILSQHTWDPKERFRLQARAAMDKLADILEAAMLNPDDPFVPDGATVVNAIRLIARTPSEYLF
jgi:hypothetical protein